MKTPNLKYFRVTILIFRGLVTSSERDHRTRQEHFPISGQWWPCVYLARIWRYGASKILGSRVWPSGVTWRHRSHDHLTRHNVVSYWWSIVNMHLSCTVTEIWGSKDIGVTTLTLVTTLTFWGHVTSSVTWPSDSAWALSYWWSMMTMCLSCTDMKIRGFRDFGVTSLEPCVCAPWRRYKASNSHLPMLKAKSSLRNLRVTWPVCRASKITTYLEFPSLYCLFAIQLLWGYDDD